MSILVLFQYIYICILFYYYHLQLIMLLLQYFLHQRYGKLILKLQLKNKIKYGAWLIYKDFSQNIQALHSELKMNYKYIISIYVHNLNRYLWCNLNILFSNTTTSYAFFYSNIFLFFQSPQNNGHNVISCSYFDFYDDPFLKLKIK